MYVCTYVWCHVCACVVWELHVFLSLGMCMCARSTQVAMNVCICVCVWIPETDIEWLFLITLHLLIQCIHSFIQIRFLTELVADWFAYCHLSMLFMNLPISACYSKTLWLHVILSWPALNQASFVLLDNTFRFSCICGRVFSNLYMSPALKPVLKRKS